MHDLDTSREGLRVFRARRARQNERDRTVLRSGVKEIDAVREPKRRGSRLSIVAFARQSKGVIYMHLYALLYLSRPVTGLILIGF